MHRCSVKDGITRIAYGLLAVSSLPSFACFASLREVIVHRDRAEQLSTKPGALLLRMGLGVIEWITTRLPIEASVGSYIGAIENRRKTR